MGPIEKREKEAERPVRKSSGKPVDPQLEPIDKELEDGQLEGIELSTLPKKKPLQDRPKARAVEQDLGTEVLNFIGKHTDIDLPNCEVTRTTDLFNIAKLEDLCFSTIVNLQRINDVQGIDELLRATNLKLPIGGRFIGCVETLEASKKRIFKNNSAWKAPLMYISDFVVKRVFPKLRLTRSMYFLLTGGKNRSISKTEALGRCVFCGFRLDEIQELNGILYFACSKVEEPKEGPAPSKGMLLRIPRVGRGGKQMTIYKFRTMHPYAEYLQDYVIKKYGYNEQGKPANDFRLTPWGRFLRKYWLDELPMLINLLKGDVKLVGVRPLSLSKFNLYPKDMQKLRTSTTPGLVPPFYRDLPTTFEELLESEKKYLLAYKKNPIKTDVEYFLKILYNIFINNARSS